MRQRLTDHMANKQAAAGLRREISDDFKYDKKKLKHLHRILHNVNIAVGTLGSALGEFSRVKGPTISPDGLLGGLGYIMPIKNVKEVITNSVHSLSEVADSIADELSNPHWDAVEDKETKEVLKEKEKVEEETQDVLETPPDAEMPSEEPEAETEDNVTPEDVVTSKDVRVASINPDKILPDAVREALVRFSSVGRAMTSGKPFETGNGNFQELDNHEKSTITAALKKMEAAVEKSDIKIKGKIRAESEAYYEGPKTPEYLGGYRWALVADCSNEFEAQKLASEIDSFGSKYYNMGKTVRFNIGNW